MATPRKPPEQHLKRGAPSPYDPNFHPQDFIDRSRQGKNITQIASAWMLRRETLWDWGKRFPEFGNAMELGRQLCENWYLETGQGAMVGALKSKETGKKINLDLGMFKLLTRNMFGWSENTKVELQGKLQVNTFVDLVKELEQEEDEL